MKVICPHVNLNPATEFCLNFQVDRSRLQVEFIKYEPEQTDGYWTAINNEWDKKEGFIIVEGDIVPWPGALEEIEACHQNLCNFWAPSGWRDPTYSLGYGLGCTKFSAQLIHNHPDIMDEIANTNLGKHWHHIDGQLLERLIQRGEAQHFHSPPVSHINRSRFPVR